MRIMSLQQFVQQAREPQDSAPRTLLVTVDELIAALELFEGDRPLAVSLDVPQPDTIAVNFFPPVDETEH